MSTEHNVPLARVLAMCATLTVLSACQEKAAAPAQEPQGASQLGWAREALDRNPNIEVVAVDRASGVFTLRSKATGEMTAVAVSDLAAAPIAQLAQPVIPPAATVAAPPVAAAPAQEAPAAPPAPAAQAPAPTPARDPAATAALPVPGFDPSYTIERANGQVKVSGPGVSIVSSGSASDARAGTGGATAATDPIICEGRRLLHLDGRTLNVDGDAVVARDGCELYITNSRIVGSRMGVLIQDAIVHIANSHIEGATASFEADGRAKVFVRNSTFQGLSRRDQLAQVQDQGGNRWH
jgi:hypothetical protein